MTDQDKAQSQPQVKDEFQFLIDLGCTGLRPTSIWSHTETKEAIQNPLHKLFVVIQNVCGYSERWDYFWPIEPGVPNGLWFYQTSASKAHIRLHETLIPGQTVNIFDHTFNIEAINGEEFTAKLTRSNKI
jgi:hypothetical protein